MITIVSGLPRSGTSLAMQMLAAGGLPALTDGVRQQDENNPRGYFEFSPVLNLARGQAAWRAEAEGHAVKITWPVLRSLPAEWAARVVWMERAPEEIVASQARMLARSGLPVEDAAQLTRAFTAMQGQARGWLDAQRGLAVLVLNHAELMHAPAVEAARLAAWLGGGLNVTAMAAAVEPALWRERRTGV